jgi:D-alanyl-D-alanine carboxypeptidase
VNDAALDRIRGFIDRHRGRLQTPGLSLALTDRAGTVGLVTDGLADLAAGTPVREDHRFQIGSISKGCTAIAILQLREEGRIDLEAPLVEYLPWFDPGTRFAPITIHHLLTHTSGLITGMDFTGEAAHELWALREGGTGCPPGERMRYSNLGYKALGVVIERVTGRPWWEHVRERVLAPMGMGDADPIITTEIRPRLATGHTPRFDDRPWLPRHGWVEATWSESATADGTICATSDELAAYCRLLLNEGKGPDGPVLSPESFALMTAPVAQDPDAPTHVFGYGVKWISEPGSRPVLGHSGGMLGFTSYALVDVEAGVGVTVLANASNGVPLLLARFAIACMAAEALGAPIPAAPEPEDPSVVADAAAFAGEYRDDGSGEVVTVVAEGERLFIGSTPPVALVPVGTDRFAVDDTELERFAIRFLRDADVVTGFHRGPDRFVNDRYGGPASFDPPEGWNALAGHYRSWDPWGSNFRIFVRGGSLWIDAEEDVLDAQPARPLVPLAHGSFHVGDEHSPDRIAFDTVIDGYATRAIYDCARFYRTFTP